MCQERRADALALIQYIIPGTGDPSASIPSEFYSTRDPASLEAFIRESDVLVASLPGTRETEGLLDAEKLGKWNLVKVECAFHSVGTMARRAGVWCGSRYHAQSRSWRIDPAQAGR